MRRFSIISFLTLCLTLMWGQTRSQTPDLQFEAYDLSDGLPSNETYFVHQDSLGYLWIGTDQGLVRYDGYRFRTYTTANSKLTYNTVFAVTQSPKGELWFTCYDGSVTIYEVGSQKFKPFWFNDSLRKWNRRWVSNIYFGSDTVYFQNLGDLSRYAVASLDGKYIVDRPFNEDDWVTMDVDVRYRGGGKSVSTKFVSIVKLFRERRKTRPAPRFMKQGQPNFIWTAYTELPDSSIIFSVHDKVLKWSGDSLHLIHRFREGERTNQFFYDRQYQRLFIVTEGGLYVPKGGKVRKVLSGDFSRMAKDREGNYWLSTDKRGILRIPYIPESVANYSFNGRKIVALKSYKECLLIGGDKEDIGSLCSLDDEIHLVARDFLLGESRSEVVSFIENEGVMLSSHGLQLRKKNGQIKSDFYFTVQENKVVDYRTLSQFNMVLSGNRLIASGMNTGYWVYPHFGKDSFVAYNDVVSQRILDMHRDAMGRIWLSTLSGVWYLNESALDRPVKTSGITALEGRVNQVLSTADNILFFATSDRGILLWDGTDTLLIDESKGLISNAVNCLELQGDSILWVGTNRGVSKVRFSQDFNSVFVQMNLNSDDGLLGDFIHSMAIWENSLWFGLEDRLQGISLGALGLPSTRPRMILQELTVMQKDQADFSISEFRHNENDISIRYAGISFKKPKENFYRYRLVYDQEFSETEFVYTDNTNVDLFNLSPGEYTFEIACRDKNNNWSETKAYAFTIIPHYTDTVWFRTLVILGSSLIVLLLVYWQVREIRRKNTREGQLRELEYKFKESELAILRNQMNPHFVFNALNSIQSYVLDNDIATASGYLQKFSVLMRSSLEYSMDDWITLDKEIGFLDNYLNIERLRFPDRFTYEISIGREIDSENIEIPPLLIQPIVENCVKHAFRDEHKSGLIRICFEVEGNGLLCVVQDNGVGYKHKNFGLMSEHRSYGMEVVRNRLELLGSDHFKPAIKVYDLADLGDGDTGTRVEIRLPIE